MEDNHGKVSCTLKKTTESNELSMEEWQIMESGPGMFNYKRKEKVGYHLLHLILPIGILEHRYDRI